MCLIFSDESCQIFLQNIYSMNCIGDEKLKNNNKNNRIKKLAQMLLCIGHTNKLFTIRNENDEKDTTCT